VERTAGPSTALRFGRDDNSKGGAPRRYLLAVERTAGPSTALRFGRDDNSKGGAPRRYLLAVERTAGPSTALRFDGMTILRVALSDDIC
jgi:hypothetical protein